MKSGMNSKGNWTLLELEGSSSYPNSRYRVSTLQIKVKHACEVNRATILCRKIIAEESVTFQNIFSSLADFCDVVSVMPCSPTNKGKW